MQATKTADSKGRVTLGEQFANRTVLVEAIDSTEVHITLARVIPEREAWLYKNSEARKRIAKGIAQARRHQFATTPPELVKDAVLADQLEDES